VAPIALAWLGSSKRSHIEPKRNTQIDHPGEPACVALTAWM
jgi:hypothetical protein